jgi:DHA3 family macrolide efflux protein-like MFS transporter
MSKAPSSSFGLRVFAILWAGQAISLFGSNLTNFALGVWVYQNTGSATQFALVTVCMVLPSVCIAPIAGALVDRWDRRWSMLLGDGCDALIRLLMLSLIGSGELAPWHVYLFVALSSFFRAFQVPAFSAATALLVPKRHLGRANGLAQASVAGAQILSPLAAGFLLGAIGLTGIVGVNLATAAVGLTSILLVRLPRPEPGEQPQDRRPSLLHDAATGWRYVRDQKGLLRLLVLTGSINFCFGTVYVLLNPMILSFASSRELGMVLGCASFGILVGSLVLGAWGGPKQRVRGIFGFALAQSFVLSLSTLRPHLGLIAAGAFAYMFFNPLILGCTRTILQTKVLPRMQGRVFALANMIITSSIPLAAIVAGPLADHLFEPWMAPGGRLASSAGLLLGVGKGRGIALLCLSAALSMALFILLALRDQPLRNLEREIPDALPDNEAQRAVSQEPASA